MGDGTNKIIGEVAASIISRLARSRDGSAVSDNPQQDVSALDERNCACDSERLGEGTAPKQAVPQMSHDQLPRTKPSSDEYRRRVDACLSWAQEARTDEVRLACLTLAQAWLRAAMHDGGDVSDSLPLAPTL
jgi:hypothetical protein